MRSLPASFTSPVSMLCAALSAGASPAAAQSIVAGPVFNPASGSRYYLIQTGNYAQLRAFAVGMGGDLATVNDNAENTFLAANFAQTNKPFIGLNDASTEGTFLWSDGSSSTFRKWRSGEPNNSASRDFVRMATPAGEWEVVTESFTTEAIVEISAQQPVRVPQERLTIQSALAALSQAGTDRVLVAPGEYTLVSPITISNAEVSGSGMGITTFNAPLNLPAFELYNDALLRNATIVKRSNNVTVNIMQGSGRVHGVEFTSLPGNGSSNYIDMNAQGEIAWVERCVFSNGESALDANTGAFRVINSIFRDLNNVSLQSSSGREFTFTNCLFTRIGPAIIFDPNSNNTVTNSIFFQNTGSIDAFVNVQYSLLSSPFPGEGNKVGNPLFANAQGNNFTPQPTSPAIDAGSIARYIAGLPEDILDLANNPRAVDAPDVPNALARLSPIDMGPLEFQPPAATDTCKPDFNNDGFVDDTDFVTFAQFYDNFTCP